MSSENILPYLISINILSIILTLYDKWASKNKGRIRISERYLMAAAILGGAISMFITMKIIRHKTLHKKFMVTLPVIIIIQGIILFILLR